MRCIARTRHKGKSIRRFHWWRCTRLGKSHGAHQSAPPFLNNDFIFHSLSCSPAAAVTVISPDNRATRRGDKNTKRHGGGRAVPSTPFAGEEDDDDAGERWRVCLSVAFINKAQRALIKCVCFRCQCLKRGGHVDIV